VSELRDIEWLDPLPDRDSSPELERFYKAEVGFAPPYIQLFASCPWIQHADIDLDITFASAEITDMFDLIYLVISRDNSCRFCYGNSRLLMRMSGVSDKRIRTLEEDVEMARLEPKMRLALEYTRRVSRSNPAPDHTDRKQLREAGYSESAVRELAFAATDVVFHNRYSTLLALPPRFQERVSRTPLVHLLKLRMRKLFQRLEAPGRATPLPEEFKAGPYSNVVVALDGLPHAPVLRKILDEAWASPNLPPRTKALIFAVVARALESAAAEREARRLLAAEGIDERQVDEILAHLGSAELDGTENQILPYVRETIRYQPAVIQRRGRGLRKQLSNAQLLETVGFAALANMVCRLALQLEDA
jgi:alkylhydroperoxidase family enzyme